MKNKFYLLNILSILIIASGFIVQREPLIQSKILHKIIDDKAKVLEKKYRITAIGDTVGMPDGIVEELGISFDKVGPLSKEEGRKIILDSVKELLSAVNSNNELKPYLVKYPLTEENIHVVIFVKDRRGNDVYEPNICAFSISNGNLVYRTLGVKNPNRYKTTTKETYLEALSIVQKNN